MLGGTRTIPGAMVWGRMGRSTPSPCSSALCPWGFALLSLAGSIKAGRRSSYLLAITTERSKSCDDGLNAFRDEGKILR